MKVNLNDNFELSPSRLSQLIGWLRHYAIRVCVTLMKLEVHFFNIRGHVFIGIRFHVHGPLMRVTVLFSFLAEVSSDIAVHYWFYYHQSLENTGR